MFLVKNKRSIIPYINRIFLHFFIFSSKIKFFKAKSFFDFFSMSHKDLSHIKIPNRIGNYQIKGTIGEGAFSVVRLAYDDKHKQYFACKIVPKSRLSSNSLQRRFEEEIRIDQQLHHPGVVSLIDIIQDDFNFYVIMEFCPNGELFQYIVDRSRLTEDEAKPKMKMILDSIRYLHSLRISHRDLKPENILLDQYGQPKLSDFGLSRFVGEDCLVSTPCGSPCYASPECISGQPYNGLTSDVWSCGVVLFAMVTGQLPWTKRNQAQLFEQIRNGEYTIPRFVSQNCYSLLRGLLTVDITKRLTIEQALNHPWFANVPDIELQHYKVTSSVSLKRVDEYFGKSISSLNLTNIQRSPSLLDVGIDFTIREISAGPQKQKILVKKKVKKLKKVVRVVPSSASKQIDSDSKKLETQETRSQSSKEVKGSSEKRIIKKVKKHSTTRKIPQQVLV